MTMADPLFWTPMSVFIYNLLPPKSAEINTTQVAETKRQLRMKIFLIFSIIYN